MRVAVALAGHLLPAAPEPAWSPTTTAMCPGSCPASSAMARGVATGEAQATGVRGNEGFWVGLDVDLGSGGTMDDVREQQGSTAGRCVVDLT